MSERLVELLEPRPGQTIVDLAAGPGDTGFLAAPLVQPGGRLVTTDVAPEMLDAARRRAEELGLDDGEFRVEDIAALSFDDATVDGILCRWGLMLVPDMDAAAAEIRRVLRADGRVALAVWGSPDDNDWMTAPGRSALELGLVERPDPAAPGPFRLSADGALAAVLRSAGLTVETVEDVRLVWRSPIAGRVVGRGEGHLAHAFDAARASEPEGGAGGAGRSGATARRVGRSGRLGRRTGGRPGRPRGATGLRPRPREEMARAGLEPATPRFSAVCSTS